MAQVSYGTITITDTNDIERIYVEYCRSTSNQLNTSVTPPVVPNITINWGENTPPWVNNQYIWQRSVIKKSGTNELIYGTPVCLTGAQGTTGEPGRGLTGTSTMYCNYGNGTPADNDERWQSTPPVYNSAYPNYWVKITNTYSAAPLTDIIKYKDEALTQTIYNAAMAQSISQSANENSQGAMSIAATTQIAQEALATKLKYIWTDEIEDVATPAGSYMASGINGITFNTQNPATYGFNSQARHSRVAFRYNAIDLTTIGIDGVKINIPIINNSNTVINSAKGVELTSSALKFYHAPTISGSTVTDGNLGVELTNSALNFYNTNGTLTSSFGNTISLASNGASITIGSSQNEHITIDTNGLKIYGNYSYNNNGTSTSMYGLLGSFGNSVQIGPLNTGHITLNTTGATFYDSANTTIGVIGNTDLYYSTESYKEVVEVNWVSNETFTYDKQFNYDTNINSILIAIKNGDTIDWSSAQTVTSPWGRVYINLDEYMVPITISPSAVTGRTDCIFSSTSTNPTTDTTLAFKINHTPSMPGPHYSFGIDSIAPGTGSFAAGRGIKAVGPYQTVLGRYNKKDLDASFIIGNGTDDNNRSNLFVVDGEGNLRVNNGFQIYNNDETDSVAEFGSFVRIGKINNSHYVFIDNNSLDIRKGTTTLATFSNTGIILCDNNSNNLKITNNSIEEQFLLADNEYVSPFKIESKMNGDGLKSLLVSLGRSSSSSVWTKVLDYTPKTGTPIIIFIVSAIAEFTAGTASTITLDDNSGTLEYDGVATITKTAGKSVTSGQTLWAKYFIQGPTTDMMIGTRTWMIGSAVLQEKFPCYTIGENLIPSKEYSFTIGKNNQYISSGCAFVIGNGAHAWATSNALTVDWNGNVDIASGASYKINGTSLIDIFYPIGSYYETSDTTFDPNTAWGGTWSLETEGLVHIGAGSTYTVGNTGGNKDAIVPYHNHTLTNPTVKTPALTVDNSHAGEYIGSASAISSLNRQLGSVGSSGGDYNYLRVAHTGVSLTRSSPSISAGKTCTVTGGSIGYAGTSGNLTNANMQPYIVVNRWHRTA